MGFFSFLKSVSQRQSSLSQNVVFWLKNQVVFFFKSGVFDLKKLKSGFLWYLGWDKSVLWQWFCSFGWGTWLRTLAWVQEGESETFNIFRGKQMELRSQGFPGGTCGKQPTCWWRRSKRHGFDSWVWKIPWRRRWQPTPVFLPGESHGQRSVAGYSPCGCKSWTWLK